ncbi:hypothetical protein LGM43_22815 [Burkholderia seminalis]|uniref:hypothetical protein n=1 Tax=Burkholderia seminalis TaxID=488731 RepID=UPI001CF2466D|nr:hypothetical protein [Burkholderia seminalis]MCA7953107.1 hypothetical protein [Burkholderia seminalis]
MKDFCKSLSNASDNLRFAPLKLHSFHSLFNQEFFYPQSFFIFRNRLKIKGNSFRQPTIPRTSLPVLALPIHAAQKTKYCQTPPPLSDDNSNLKSFSTDRKLTGVFHQYRFAAQTIAKRIQTFYCDTLPPSLIPVH